MDFACDECGSVDADSYVVTAHDVTCYACHELDGDLHGDCISMEENADQLEEAEKSTRESIIYELKSSLDSLVRAVEFERPEDIVSSTDLLLHGLPVAIARTAYEIALEAAGEVEAWRR